MSDLLPVLAYQPPARRRAVQIDRDQLGIHITIPTPFAAQTLIGWVMALLMAGIAVFAIMPFIIILCAVIPHRHLFGILTLILCIPVAVIIVRAALVYSTQTLIYLEENHLIVELPGMFTDHAVFQITPQLTVRAMDVGLGALLQIRNAEGYLNLCEGISMSELHRIESALCESIMDRLADPLPQAAAGR